MQSSEVKVIERGNIIANDQIIELKSYADGKPPNNRQIAELWLAQTQHLFTCQYRKELAATVTTAPKRYNMKEVLTAWETKNQRYLQALVNLLGQIKNTLQNAKTQAGRQCMLVCKKEDRPPVLRLYERNGAPIHLPKGTISKCWAR